jgi:hypothetical protein
MGSSNRILQRVGAVAGALLVASIGVAPALAGPREQAKRMHDRLVGVPPAPAVLDQMTAAIAGGDPLGAADLALAHPLFYSSALKNFVTPWTNVAQTVFAPLNDYTATVIGIVRDDRPFTEVLSADVVYVGAPGTASVGYSHTNNTHYEDLENRGVDLSNPALLVPMAQSALPGAQVPTASTAGVLTTRAAGAAFLVAGTNRRMWRFTAIQYLCRDMEALNDITRPSDRIRQDVTRSPGGDSRIFHNTCVGCHSGMDPLAGAFAYFNFDETLARVVYTPGVVQPKNLINANSFPFGYRTTSDRWDNYWRAGPNAALDWRAAQSGGNGPKGLGVEVASSRAFSVCQVEKVFQRICLHPAQTPAEAAAVQRIADVFEAQNYSLKRVFAETAVFCMGE